MTAPIAEPEDSWPSYPDHEPLPLSDFGLYLYMTFEDLEDDWWLPEQEVESEGPIALRPTSPRTGR